MKRGYSRTERISDLIQKALAQILMHDMMSNDFRLVTITGVTVSKDLSYAKVHISVLMDDIERIKIILRTLNNHAKPIRYELAHAVKLRVVPELRFVYDESTAHGYHISTLIDSAMKKTDKK